MEDESPKPQFELLPTGKPHVSFSEVKDWDECSWRHKLKQVDKLAKDDPGVHADFGTAIHATCEVFLPTRKIETAVFKKTLHELWVEHAKVKPEAYTTEAFKQFAKEGLAILPEIPKWFDDTFPGWEFVDAEHQLYEPIDSHPHAFKGFIDAIIKVPGKKNPIYWLLDFKTCGWGWAMEKKNDPMVKMQLVLYKNYWAIKTNTPPKDIRCGFILLKRTAKAGQKCELVTTSVGDVTTKRSLNVVNNMLHSVKKGKAFKNRQACQYCEFYGTKHCT